MPGRGMQFEFIYGRQPVREVLAAKRRRVAGLFLLKNARPSPELDAITSLASRQGISVMKCDSNRILSLVGQGTNHQGIVAEVSTYPYVPLEDVLRSLKATGQGTPPLYLLLDRVQDPQNLGSLMRSAEACGVSGLVLPADRAVHVTPAAVRASAGASEHIRTVIVKNLNRAIRELQAHGVMVAGLEGEPEQPAYTDISVHGPVALVVGSEGRGLRPGVLQACDTLMRIPMHGSVNSLNAAIAGALAMFQLRERQAL